MALSNPKIEKLLIEKIDINVNKFPYTNKEVLNNIAKLLPSTARQKISFYIKNANTAIVNGLRRIVEGELKTKVLNCNLDDIDTDEEFIIKSELLDRINYIPINQDIPINFEFSLSANNTSINDEYLVIRSNDIKKPNNSIYYFPETIKLAKIKPRKYLKIPKLTIREGYGFEHSSHCLTNQSEYQIIDHIPVTFINERANFVSKRVKVIDLLSLFKKLKINYDDTPDNLFRKKILIIPNKNYKLQLTALKIKTMEHYEIIVENPDDVINNKPNNDDLFLKEYHSSEIKSKDFYLAFATYGNIDSKVMIMMACDNIVERLLKLSKAINDYSNGILNDDLSFLTIITDNVKTTIIIRGEDYTIGELMKKTIYELDSNISLINSPLEHPLNRTITLNIIHQQPIKISLDAINHCVKIFNNIKTQFM